MPYKHHEPRRDKIKKSKYRVENWREYNDALRQRGNITFYFTDDAIAKWNSERVSGQRGRPQEYSTHAIECCLMIRQVFRLPLRQTEGFMCSMVEMMGLDLFIPDYSCISKRSIGLKLKRLIDSIEPGSYCLVDSTGLKVYGKDEWHQEKHKVKARRSWCKLHLAIDENHQILTSDLTENSVGDTTALAGLLNQIEDVKTFMGDGAYDGDTIYQQIIEKQPHADIVIPPPKNAVANASEHDIRNQHVDVINERGRMAWQKETGYGLRALVELAMLRYKTLIGPKLKARKLSQQKTEAAVSVRVLNIMTALGMPISVKIA
jgi:hypothetical protein